MMNVFGTSPKRSAQLVLPVSTVAPSVEAPGTLGSAPCAAAVPEIADWATSAATHSGTRVSTDDAAPANNRQHGANSRIVKRTPRENREANRATTIPRSTQD